MMHETQKKIIVSIGLFGIIALLMVVSTASAVSKKTTSKKTMSKQEQEEFEIDAANKRRREKIAADLAAARGRGNSAMDRYNQQKIDEDRARNQRWLQKSSHQQVQPERELEQGRDEQQDEQESERQSEGFEG